MNSLLRDVVPQILIHAAYEPCRRVCSMWRKIMIKKYGEEMYISCSRPLSSRIGDFQMNVILGVFLLKYKGRVIYWTWAMNILSVKIGEGYVIIHYQSNSSEKEIVFKNELLGAELQYERDFVFKPRILLYKYSNSTSHLFELINLQFETREDIISIIIHDNMLFIISETSIFTFAIRDRFVKHIKSIPHNKNRGYISYTSNGDYHWVKLTPHFGECSFYKQIDILINYINIAGIIIHSALISRCLATNKPNKITTLFITLSFTHMFLLLLPKTTKYYGVFYR